MRASGCHQKARYRSRRSDSMSRSDATSRGGQPRLPIAGENESTRTCRSPVRRGAGRPASAPGRGSQSRSTRPGHRGRWKRRGRATGLRLPGAGWTRGDGRADALRRRGERAHGPSPATLEALRPYRLSDAELRRPISGANPARGIRPVLCVDDEADWDPAAERVGATRNDAFTRRSKQPRVAIGRTRRVECCVIRHVRGRVVRRGRYPTGPRTAHCIGDRSRDFVKAAAGVTAAATMGTGLAERPRDIPLGKSTLRGLPDLECPVVRPSRPWRFKSSSPHHSRFQFESLLTIRRDGP